MRVLAIVPAYNEEESLQSTVEELMASCPDVDVLVVNDGSRDATGAICDREGYNHLDMPINCGLTSASNCTAASYPWRSAYFMPAWNPDVRPQLMGMSRWL